MYQINFESVIPIYEQIVRQVKFLVASGALSEGEFVPSVREVAKTQMINPQTVVKAYALLKADGVLSPIRGQGFVVARGASELCRGARQEMFQSRIEETLEEAALGRVSPDEMTQMLKSALAKTVAKYYPSAPIAWGCDSEK